MDPLSAQQRNKIRRLAAEAPEAAPDQGGGEINVVPFLDIVTNVLMFVLATVAITFTATVDVSPPRRGIRPPTEAKLDLTVLVVDGGFALKTHGGNVATGCTGPGEGLAVPKRDGAYDYRALEACAAKLKAAVPGFAGETNVTIGASPNIAYEVVIATTDALRTSKDGDPLFPDVAFAIAR
jgi:biopolymer transport protein ExbD